MAIAALVLLVAWLVLVGGLQGFLRYRRTGEVRIGARDRPGSAQWWAKVISTVGVLLAFAAPVAELVGLRAFGVVDHEPIRVGGAAVAIAGMVSTLACQWAMGDAWRGDVDPDERSELVTSGPFRLVRNPILTSTAATAIGLALMVPNVVSLLMLVALISAHQIQVKLVEEPYLLRVHGDAYRAYAARTGRFVPWIGRIGARGDG